MLLTAQHCRPAAACLGRQPGTASRPSCMRARRCTRVQASPPTSPLSSVDELKREGEQRRNAAELDTTAQELHQHISSMMDDQSPTEPTYANTNAELPPSMPYVPTGAPETAVSLLVAGEPKLGWYSSRIVQCDGCFMLSRPQCTASDRIHCAQFPAAAHTHTDKARCCH